MIAAEENLPPLPPARLLFMRESREQILRNGKALLALLKGHVTLGSGPVVDIGCGYGRMAYTLAHEGFQGTYLGIDIKKPSIDWLQENFSSRLPRYQFRHVDIGNERYNKAGRLTGSDLAIDARYHHPDLILVLSVFTHMYEEDLVAYLKTIAAIMSPKSVLYATFFLMSEEQRQLEAAGKSRYLLRHAINDHCRVADPLNPLHVIAYDQHWIMNLVASQGLRCLEFMPGWWCGRKSKGVAQDTLILAKI